MASPSSRFLRSLSPLLCIRWSPSPASPACRCFATAVASAPSGDAPAAPGTEDDSIYLKRLGSAAATTRDQTSVTMPMSFMTGSIVGKRFYKEVTTRMSNDGNGWTVMLDYRTLKTPSKRPLKLRSLALAKAVAAEWQYQLFVRTYDPSHLVLARSSPLPPWLFSEQTDGIRPFTMPLMKLTCTALERVPLTRAKIIENLMKKFHQDLVFCRSPGDTDLTIGFLKKQEEKIDPILDWVHLEFGFKPVVYSSFFGGKQDAGFAKAVENVLKETNDFELAAIDAMAAAAHSLVIPLGIYRGRIGIEEAMQLIRLEEDLQVDRWGLVEGGHDVDIADLKVQISSAIVLLGLSKLA